MALVLRLNVRVIELNIYEKLAKIRKPVEVLSKNKQAFNYKYVTEDEILAKVTGLMDKLNVSLIPHIVPGTTEVTPYTYIKTKVIKDKVIEQHVNEIIVKADMEFHWVNNEDPEDRIVVPWVLVGQQEDASMAVGSGLSYNSRYFLLKYFNVSTPEDDPDNWRSKQKEAMESENRAIADGITNRILDIINTHLEKNPDDRDDIIVIVKEYAKSKGKPSTNPKVITDPEVAAKLLKAIMDRCGIAEDAA